MTTVSSKVTLVNLNIYRHTAAQEKRRRLPWPLKKRDIPWPIGPLYIAAALEQAGFSVDFRDYQLVKPSKQYRIGTMVDFIGTDSADLIFISCTSAYLPYAVICACRLKLIFPYKMIVLGGIGPSGVARELLAAFPLIDIVAIGEGERTTVDIARAIRDKRPLNAIKGIGFHSKDRIVLTRPQERIRDLDSLQRPAYHLIDLRKYNSGGISISRGCPHACSFCNLVGMWHRTVTTRSTENVLEELKYLRSKGKKIVSFVDDTFITDTRRTKELCTALAKSGQPIQYNCQARVDTMSPATLSMLKKSGCHELFFGIESGSNRILRRLKKGFTIEQALRSIAMARKAGFSVITSFMWGFPFETTSDFLKTLHAIRAAKRLGCSTAFSVLTPLPLSPIYDEFKDTLVFPEDKDLFVSGMLGQDRIEDPEVLALIEQYPHIFPSFYYYDSPALKEKIALINASSTRQGLHYAARR